MNSVEVVTKLATKFVTKDSLLDHHSIEDTSLPVDLTMVKYAKVNVCSNETRQNHGLVTEEQQVAATQIQATRGETKAENIRKLKFGIDSILNTHFPCNHPDKSNDEKEGKVSSEKFPIHNDVGESNHANNQQKPTQKNELYPHHGKLLSQLNQNIKSGHFVKQSFSKPFLNQYNILHHNGQTLHTVSQTKDAIYHPYLSKQRPALYRIPSDPLPTSCKSQERLRSKSECCSSNVAVIDNSLSSQTDPKMPTTKENTTVPREHNLWRSTEASYVGGDNLAVSMSKQNLSNLSSTCSANISARSKCATTLNEQRQAKSHLPNSEQLICSTSNTCQSRTSSRADVQNFITEATRLSTESDDVFDDDRNSNYKIISSPHELFQKRRHNTINTLSYIQDTENIFPSPKQLRGNSFFLSPTNLPSPPSFRHSVSSAQGRLSLQAWQAMAANCHSSLQQLVYPYPYTNNAAATAVAMAAMRSSLKSMTFPSLVLPDDMQAHKTAPNEAFRLQDINNGQATYGEKSGGPRKRRKWSRAVFSLMQRRGLEKSFQIQKYVAKPERRGLAEALGLTDAQVKIWFQNRRMKWRQEQKSSSKNSISDGEDTSSLNGEQQTFA